MAAEGPFKMKLVPEDDFMHPVEAAENFNESMYFNVFDADQKIGGFFRCGNRPASPAVAPGTRPTPAASRGFRAFCLRAGPLAAPAALRDRPVRVCDDLWLFVGCSGPRCQLCLAFRTAQRRVPGQPDPCPLPACRSSCLPRK